MGAVGVGRAPSAVAPVTLRGTIAAVAVLPSAWVLAEAVRSWHRLGGPWALLGASQWNQPATLVSASLGGVWLTSFLLVATNTAVTGMILHRGVARRAFTLAVALVCAGLGPAWFVLSPAPPVGPTVRVALVQPGDITDSAARQAGSEKLTATLAGQHPDLVVWGESSIGVDLASTPALMAQLTNLSRRVGADLLVNVDARSPRGGIYKSSNLIGPNGSRGAYQKTRLVPFGEYVPLRPLLGWITGSTKAAAEDRRRGSGQVVLHTDSMAIGPLISFETTFSDLPRREVQLGAQLLVYQSSTSTFQGSWAQPQLASQVAVHAVEVGRAAVHTGLSGVSSAFDAEGRADRLVPVHLSGRDHGGRSARVAHHCVPTAGRLGTGAGVVDPCWRDSKGSTAVPVVAGWCSSRRLLLFGIGVPCRGLSHASNRFDWPFCG